MAVPKKRHSKSRVRTKRSTIKANRPTVSKCAQCHEPKMSHRVCPHCGSYGGRTAVEMPVDA